MVARQTRADGERTRAAIVRESVSLATIDGLEGLSIGHLAGSLNMSKSGVYAHFGSKEELQLATIDEAGRIFRVEVVEPALAAAPGVRQLVALCDAFFDHLQRQTFPGGCFFAGAVLETGTRPGPVKDEIAAFQRGLHQPRPPVRRHRARTPRTRRRRRPRRADLRTQRHHPRRQRQLRPAPRSRRPQPRQDHRPAPTRRPRRRTTPTRRGRMTAFAAGVNRSAQNDRPRCTTLSTPSNRRSVR